MFLLCTQKGSSSDKGGTLNWAVFCYRMKEFRQDWHSLNVREGIDVIHYVIVCCQGSRRHLRRLHNLASLDSLIGSKKGQSHLESAKPCKANLPCEASSVGIPAVYVGTWFWCSISQNVVQSPRDSPSTRYHGWVLLVISPTIHVWNICLHRPLSTLQTCPTNR